MNRPGSAIIVDGSDTGAGAGLCAGEQYSAHLRTILYKR